ncbi:hypothetical protein GCM10027443_17800 [Pontibacter brevis]
MDCSAKHGISIIGIFDEQYPALLKETANPPVLLHCKGDISTLESPTVAVIGTREPSAHVVETGPKIAESLIGEGLTLVSGLAKGCDTIAHQASVDADKPTIAVLAGGLHSVYPKENMGLSEKILEKGGVLISELPYGQEPQRSSFVDRDRIQSGISYGVVVLETGVKGGTLHTVKFAREQDRIVGCMYTQASAGYGDHEKFQGNKVLVESGQAVKLGDSILNAEFINRVKARYRSKR